MLSKRRPFLLLSGLLLVLLAAFLPKGVHHQLPRHAGYIAQRLRPRPFVDRLQPPWTQASHASLYRFTIDNMAPDRLRRRDYASASKKAVPISRPDLAHEPLAKLPLSPTFMDIYNHLSTKSWTFRKDYDAHLRTLLAQNRTEHCGPWVGRYTELHNHIVSSYDDLDFSDHNVGVNRTHLAGRIIHSCQKVFGQCGGLADRIYGIVFTFLYSLLLDRAYLHYWEPDYPILAEDMWRSPYINWAWNAPPHPWNASLPASPHALGFHHHQVFEIPPETDTVYLDPSRQELEYERFPWETFSTQGNRGMFMRTLLEDPAYNWQSRKLTDMGFTLDNAYGCILNYLFDPLPQTKLLVEEYSALLTMPNVFSVSVQIRSGDQQIGTNETVGLDWFRYFFGCAAHAAEKFAKPGQHTDFVIFLVTDNYELSQAAPTHVEQLLSIMPTTWEHPTIPDFQPRILTTNIKPTHSEHGEDDTDTSKHMWQLSWERRQFNMQTSLMENMIQDAADVRIVCAWSGFGQLSSLRSGKGRTTVAMGTFATDHDPPSDFYRVSCADDEAYRDLDEWADGFKVA